jgi:hypothetical protein
MDAAASNVRDPQSPWPTPQHTPEPTPGPLVTRKDGTLYTGENEGAVCSEMTSEESPRPVAAAEGTSPDDSFPFANAIAPAAITVAAKLLLKQVGAVDINGQCADENRGQDSAFCAKLRDDIVKFYESILVRKYMVGMNAKKLQHERSRPGGGTFLQDLNELTDRHRISRATIYRFIAFYEVMLPQIAELNLTCLSHLENDAANLLSNSDQTAEQRHEADERAQEHLRVLDETIRVAQAKQKQSDGKLAAKTLRLPGLTEAQRKAVQPAFNELIRLLGSEREASLFVLETIVDRANGLAEVEEHVA